MRAISVFSFDAGTSTLGCLAASALRRRVSISAMGSLNIRYPLRSYQLDFVTPGISPFSASWRKHSRHSANLRRKPRGRPQRQQRFRCRQANLGFLFAARAFALMAACFRSLAIFAVVAMNYLCLLLPERHSHALQERHALGVRPRRGRDGHIHALGLVYL